VNVGVRQRGPDCDPEQEDRGEPRMDVNELSAIEEIKQLKARHFRAADEKNWPALRASA